MLYPMSYIAVPDRHHGIGTRIATGWTVPDKHSELEPLLLEAAKSGARTYAHAAWVASMKWKKCGIARAPLRWRNTHPCANEFRLWAIR